MYTSSMASELEVEKYLKELKVKIV